MRRAASLHATRPDGAFLHAPVRTEMHKRVEETLRAELHVTLRDAHGAVLLDDVGTSGGLEVHGDMDGLIDMAPQGGTQAYTGSMSTGRWVRALLVALMALGMTVGALVSPASAAKSKATASIKANRVVVTFTGKQPTKASIRVAGKTYRLKKAKKVWRTTSLKPRKLTRIAGKKAKIKARIKGKKRVFRTKVKTGTPPVADEPVAPPADPAPVAPAPPAGLFDAPGVDRSGLDAWEAIKGYFLDSTFTNCPGGWSTCGAEERYGHFADETTVYCRLSAIGGDITNSPKPFEPIGAEQKTDGSWGVSYLFDYGDGRSRIYSWYVQKDGSVSGQYWLDTDPSSSPPTEVMTGLVWLRGAKDCSY